MIKSIKILFSVFLFGILFTAPVFSQNTVVRASIDSISLLIGEQTYIHLNVTTDKGSKVSLPKFKDSITKGIVLIKAFPPETDEIGNNRIEIKQKYLVTAFDSALYNIPPFKVSSGKDTALSNPLALKVSTVPVDTVSKKYYDIQGVMKPEFVLGDYKIIFLLVLLVCWLICAVGYLLKKYRKGSLPVFAKEKEEILPPHVKALRALDEVKSQKLWEQGLEKEFYSDLTEILKTYIGERYGSSVKEMTSGELLDYIREKDGEDPVYYDLKQILEISDYVKFAKYKSLPDENDISLKNSYQFIDETTRKQEEEEKAKALAEKNAQEKAEREEKEKKENDPSGKTDDQDQTKQS